MKQNVNNELANNLTMSTLAYCTASVGTMQIYMRITPPIDTKIIAYTAMFNHSYHQEDHECVYRATDLLSYAQPIHGCHEQIAEQSLLSPLVQ